MQTKIPVFTVLLSSLFIASCGGDGGSPSADSDSDANAGEGGSEGSDAVALDESIKPFYSQEGAEAGLKGCLNRGLYVNGPHAASIKSYKSTISPYWDTSSHDTNTYEYRYDVIELSDSGEAQVDVTTTFTSSLGNSTTTVVTPYALEGYQLRIVGPSRAVPNPNAYVYHFDLEEGESIPQTINAGSEAAPVYFTYIDTYVGREDVSLGSTFLKACRIDTLVTQETDQPQFRRRSLNSEWYALGTGLNIKSESVIYPDSEQDELLESRHITSAEINGVKIF